MTPSVRELLVGLIFLVLAAGGCGDKSGSEPSEKPAVFRGKIAATKKAAPKAAKSRKREAVKAPQAKPPIKPERKLQVIAKKGREEVSKTKPVPQAPSKQPRSAKEKPLAAARIAQKSDYFYDPTGKADPFRPLFATEALERVMPAKQKVKKPRMPLTPLQRIELSNLKLVGVIISASGNKAMVEEPSGKGYIISRGTYVGTNFGRVKQILKDRVVVEEEIKDYLSGETKLQPKELRLQKKVGDV
jgi:type IV pilus assembly protein PilP